MQSRCSVSCLFSKSPITLSLKPKAFSVPVTFKQLCFFISARRKTQNTVNMPFKHSDLKRNKTQFERIASVALFKIALLLQEKVTQPFYSWNFLKNLLWSMAIFVFFFVFIWLVSHAGMIIGHDAECAPRLQGIWLSYLIVLFSQKQEQGEGNIDVRLCLQPNNQERTNKACSYESTLVESGEYLKKGPLKSGFTFYHKVYGTANFSSV